MTFRGIETVEEVHERWKEEERSACQLHKDGQNCDDCRIIRCRANGKYELYEKPQIN